MTNKKEDTIFDYRDIAALLKRQCREHSLPFRERGSNRYQPEAVKGNLIVIIDFRQVLYG